MNHPVFSPNDIEFFAVLNLNCAKLLGSARWYNEYQMQSTTGEVHHESE